MSARTCFIAAISWRERWTYIPLAEYSFSSQAARFGKSAVFPFKTACATSARPNGSRRSSEASVACSRAQAGSSEVDRPDGPSAGEVPPLNLEEEVAADEPTPAERFSSVTTFFDVGASLTFDLSLSLRAARAASATDGCASCAWAGGGEARKHASADAKPNCRKVGFDNTPLGDMHFRSDNLNDTVSSAASPVSFSGRVSRPRCRGLRGTPSPKSRPTYETPLPNACAANRLAAIG
jgi:hypothetical protein